MALESKRDNYRPNHFQLKYCLLFRKHHQRWGGCGKQRVGLILLLFQRWVAEKSQIIESHVYCSILLGAKIYSIRKVKSIWESTRIHICASLSGLLPLTAELELVPHKGWEDGELLPEQPLCGLEFYSFLLSINCLFFFFSFSYNFQWWKWGLGTEGEQNSESPPVWCVAGLRVGGPRGHLTCPRGQWKETECEPFILGLFAQVWLCVACLWHCDDSNSLPGLGSRLRATALKTPQDIHLGGGQQSCHIVPYF